MSEKYSLRLLKDGWGGDYKNLKLYTDINFKPKISSVFLGLMDGILL
ncbi:MAG: hypothetical protein MJA84_04645 [Firmicutes bacterium]|nr:hypothetical protein [Bacillota bacterium]